MSTIASPIDFTGEVNIPNSDDAYTGVAATVQSLIDEYEPEFLTELLGEKLYNELLAGLPTGTVTTVPTGNEVFGANTLFRSMFIVGDAITVGGETHTISQIIDDTHLITVDVWVGSNIDAPYYGKLSWLTLRDKVKPLILKYVYFYYLESNTTLTTGIGEQATTTEAGNRASTWSKQVKVWNKMVRGNHDMVRFLMNNVNYPDYKVPNYYDWVYGGEYWLGCYGYKVNEIYTFKNSLNV